MSILFNNLQALQKHYPGIHGKFQHFQQDHRYSLVNAKNGLSNIKVTKGETSFFIHSNYNPLNEADNWCSHVEEQDVEVFVLWGLGLGYHLDKLKEKYPERRIVVIEPDYNIFFSLLQSRDISGIVDDKGIKLIVAEDPDEIVTQILEWLENPIFRSYKFLIYTGYIGKYDEAWNKFNDFFRNKLFNASVNLTAHDWFGDIWLENFFGNLTGILNYPYASTFFNKFKDVPCIIVGAGPSIDKNIETLKELKGKAVIIAAGTTYQVLLKNGITPDIIVALDGNAVNENIFEQIEDYEGFFIFSPQFYWKTRRRLRCKSLVMAMSSDKYFAWYNEKLGITEPILYSGPSVSNLCLNVAYEMGMNPIILTGQDLCFTANNLHAKGHFIQEKVNTDDVKHFVKVKDVNGNDVYTKKTFLMVKRYFELFAEKIGAGKTYLNATEGGLHVEGFTNVKLSEVGRQYCRKELSSYWSKVEPIYQSALQKKAKKKNDVIHASKSFFEGLRKDCETMVKLAEEGVNLTVGLLEKWEQGKEITLDLERIRVIEDTMFSLPYYKDFLQFRLKEVINLTSIKTAEDLKKSSDEKEKIKIFQKGFAKEFTEVVYTAEPVIRFIDMLFLELDIERGS